MTNREMIIKSKDAIAMLMVRNVIREDGQIVYQTPNGVQYEDFEFWKAVDKTNEWLEAEYKE